VDEFQNFANETFAEILSEARKYNLNLIIAHQYVEQMEEEVAAAVFGNVGTTIAFRVGPFDAEKLEVVFAPEFEPEDLVNLGFAQIYLSLMIDGIGSRPFSAVTIPPIEPPKRTYREEVITASRAQFTHPIEGLIYAELASGDMGIPDPEPPKKQYGPPKRPASQGNGYQGSKPQSERDTRPPMRQDQQREERRESRPPAPQGRPAPELKELLKAKSEEQQHKQEQSKGEKQSVLKSALADVLKNAGVEAPKVPDSSPVQKPPQTPRGEERKADTGDFKDKSVFEVPEEVLREIFKKEL
jgi:TraM recognition site of TraD and TraG